MFEHNVYSVWEQFGRDKFAEYRPTVGALLIHDDGNALLLVAHAKAAYGSFIPPQGGIKRRESLALALQREVKEELPGAKVNIARAKYLGDCVNQIPPERIGVVGKHKWLFWVAAPLVSMPNAVNVAEIEGYESVYSYGQLESMLAVGAVRPLKRQMILEAVASAQRLGMLNQTFSPRREIAA